MFKLKDKRRYKAKPKCVRYAMVSTRFSHLCYLESTACPEEDDFMSVTPIWSIGKDTPKREWLKGIFLHGNSLVHEYEPHKVSPPFPGKLSVS